MTAQTITTSTTRTTITTDNDISDRAREQQSLMKHLCEGPLGPEADASQVAVGQDAVGSVIPPEWAYIKIDLFDNTPAQELARGRRRLKLGLAVLRTTDQSWAYFRASLNGPWRNVKRGLDFSLEDDRRHYSRLTQVRDQMVDAGLVVRSSKFYLRGHLKRGQTVAGLSTVVAELPAAGEYLAAIIYQDQVIWRQLTGQDLTAEQRQAGIVSTSHRRQTQRLRARDLFR